MDTTHKEYVLEVFSDQNFVRDIIKGRCITAVTDETGNSSASKQANCDEF